jgi:hypothetical protein
MLDFVNGDTLGDACSGGARTGAAAGDQGTAKTELGRFAQARLALADRPHLAAEANLAEHHHVVRHGLVSER